MCERLSGVKGFLILFAKAVTWIHLQIRHLGFCFHFQCHGFKWKLNAWAYGTGIIRNNFPMQKSWGRRAWLAWRNWRLWGDLIAAFHYSTGTYNQERDQFFTWSDNDRTRGNGFIMKEERFGLDVREKLFTLRVVRYCNRLLWEAMDVPSLDEFKARLDGALSMMKWEATLSIAMGLEPGGLQGPQPILWFYSMPTFSYFHITFRRRRDSIIYT